MKSSSYPTLVWSLLLLQLLCNQQYVQSYNITPNGNNPSNLKNSKSLNRRSLFSNLAKAATTVTTITITTTTSCFPTSLISTAATAAETAPPIFVGSPPMIKAYPSIQYLIPIYTLDTSLTYLSSLLSNNPTPASIAKANNSINKFFAGGLLNNKNIFRGICVVYIDEIQYDDPDRDRVEKDKMGRFQDCDSLLKGLEKVKKPLNTYAASVAATAAASSSLSLTEIIIEVPTEITTQLETARSSLKQFLNKIPVKEQERVQAWFGEIQRVDVNKDGRLSNEELDLLNQSDREIYKNVAELMS